MSEPLTAASRPRAAHRSRRTIATASATALLATLFTTSAGVAFAAELPETYIDTASTVWSYSDDDTDPAAGSDDRLSWTTSDFDDSEWKTATGSFGAKNGAAEGIGDDFPITTLLNQYADGEAAPNVRTFHFRTGVTITADELTELNGLNGTVTYDDAVQIFVNGTQVAGFVDDKVDAAPEAERNLMYAGESNGSPITSTFTIPTESLHAGENTVAVALYQDRDTSSDIYFDLSSLELAVTPEHASFDNLVMTIGGDESARNLTWYTDVDEAQYVQYAAAPASGAEFPADGATTVEARGGETTSGEQNRRATIEGLSENTTYAYRVGSDALGWSDAQTFSTADFSGDYNFLFFGDPQIGASGNVASDEIGWQDTLDVALEQFPQSEMLFSAGDQVNTASSETEYDAFLSPTQMQQIPVVPVNGNHDVGSKAYEQHYTTPNLDTEAGAALSDSSSGGDYWFMFKDVLYLVINSNNPDIDAHEQFLRDVVAEHGDEAKWSVLAFHHSIYSVAAHVNDENIISMRNELPTLISDIGIDVVLQGHDHSYTRSYLINNGELANPDETEASNEVVAGEGDVLYVTANSASGSKYYDVTAPDAWYASVINQEKVRNYTNIEVTDDAITITTYRSEQTGARAAVNSVVDEVTLTRDDTEAPQLTVPENGEVEQGSDFDPMAGVSAVDNTDGDLTDAVSVTGSVDTATLGGYTLEYSVSDAAGNTQTATREVTVVAAGAGTGPGENPGGGAGDGSGDDAASGGSNDSDSARGELPYTGAEALPWLIAAGLLVLLGAAFATTSAVRRRRAHSA
ncbi:immunoglobulin-like domain-containing protein [Paramicrobacterium chengjingii]|uniref:immunoglobulin-like domain-containing protein n=1 Tax=Paramicrobacterium chengjingii TaxID=2769067 RepID=UPI001422F0EC|nr:immunoglobulin-like domain-containing protein [Microbacterium chengjingii]